MAFVALLLSSFFAAQAQPVPSPIPGSRLIQTSRIEGPLEVRSATADDEAVLVGTSYTKQTFAAPYGILVDVFVTTYRDALFAGGWKLIDVPKVVPNMPPPEGDVDIAFGWRHVRDHFRHVDQLPSAREQRIAIRRHEDIDEDAVRRSEGLLGVRRAHQHRFVIGSGRSHFERSFD